ncbi:MAG: mevalonate kinase [Candidatus Syntrophoarchaeum butanivorans]|uniref:Mevalonate kinase n=1 Tax=Candidatus Syntropharchaeum butanivorans TaxID=1839936 RepID=A0A1F2P696_9EURY|nr:MAG: mevalonate kinase [Candidatus Syntrophoarchaeum butanivorans]
MGESMVTYSAPAKIYLFGEHAVVYNKHAVAVAVNLRTRVSLRRSDRFIYQTDGDTRYIEGALGIFSSLKKIPGLELRVESDIPIGAGLGSSAAVTVATLGALNEEFDAGLGIEEIARLAFEVERSIQGVASPTDTFVSSVGGCVLVPDLTRVTDHLRCSIVIGDTKVVGYTKKLVKDVKELRSRETEILDLIFDTIDRIAVTGLDALSAGDYTRVGELMNINHGLLDAMGVGTSKLSELVYAARSGGALGAKITGAGGGGCIVAICEEKDVGRVVDAIRGRGGGAIVVDVAREGLRRESED